jgi:hypothetical protein
MDGAAEKIKIRKPTQNFLLRDSSKRHTTHSTEEPMYLARVQDQLPAQSLKATVWCCVSMPGQETSGISKKFAHRSGRSIALCARLAARLGNPEDRH